MSAGRAARDRLSNFQGRHSLVATTPFLPSSDFPWAASLEAATPAIQRELHNVLAHPERIPAFHQMSPDQRRISRGDHWKTYGFYVFGNAIDENCAECPETANAIGDIPGLQNAWFSILAPGYHVPPHRGPTRAVVRCHLGLEVPKPPEACWLRVADQRRHWVEGECLFFDDTFEHEVH